MNRSACVFKHSELLKDCLVITVTTFILHSLQNRFLLSILLSILCTLQPRRHSQQTHDNHMYKSPCKLFLHKRHLKYILLWGACNHFVSDIVSCNCRFHFLLLPFFAKRIQRNLSFTNFEFCGHSFSEITTFNAFNLLL